MRYSDRKRFSRVYVWGCVYLSNYTLINKAFCCVGVPHSSGFKAEEQTATAPLLRPTGTEQNTNVNRGLGDRERWRECRTEEEADVRGKTQGGVLKTGCDKKSFQMWRDCRKEMVKCGGHEHEGWIIKEIKCQTQVSGRIVRQSCNHMKYCCETWLQRPHLS